VLAVADAVVADARDDVPDAEFLGTSQGPVPLENASGGNYVALDLGQGRHAFYEHLKHGSIRVNAGDRVKRGHVIGLLGNTGSSSSGPHLHFHVSDANSTLAAEGLPYVFRRFEVLGAFETIAASASGERWKPAAQGAGGVRTMELPAANVVVKFDDATGSR
jgi:murein DD-endopeptidase MepM/ murein hydrolase activator NlpD